MYVRPLLPMRALLLTGAAIVAAPAAMAQDQATVPVVSSSGTPTDEDIDYADEIVVTAPRIAGQIDTFYTSHTAPYSSYFSKTSLQDLALFLFVLWIFRTNYHNSSTTLDNTA